MWAVDNTTEFEFGRLQNFRMEIFMLNALSGSLYFVTFSCMTLAFLVTTVFFFYSFVAEAGLSGRARDRESLSRD